MFQTAATATVEPPAAVLAPEPRRPTPAVPWHCQSKAIDLLNRIGAINNHDSDVDPTPPRTTHWQGEKKARRAPQGGNAG